jgi:hypothetical protein
LDMDFDIHLPVVIAQNTPRLTTSTAPAPPTAASPGSGSRRPGCIITGLDSMTPNWEGGFNLIQLFLELVKVTTRMW